MSMRFMMTIRAKIIGMIMLTTAVSLFASGALISIHQYDALRLAAEQQVAVLAQIVAANSAAAVSFSDEAAARQTLSTVAEQVSVREASLVLSDGKLFANWVAATGALALDAEAAAWFQAEILRADTLSSRMGTQRIDVIVPVRVGQDRIAAVHLVADTQSLDDALAAQIRLVGIAICGALLLAATLSWLLQRSISDRIAAIGSAMAQVQRSGDYAVRLVEEGGDEIADLIIGFNRMIIEVADRDAQLAAHRTDLSRQVDERTADLVATNAVLERSNLELQEAQDEVRRLALVAKNTDNAVIIANGDGRIEWVNESFERIAGHVLAAIHDLRLVDFLFGPQTDPNAIDALQQAREARQSASIELVCYTRARQPIWLGINSVPVVGATGLVEHIVTIAVDITSRKQQEQRLAEALETEREIVAQQKRFISVAAHEFRTPLTIIDGAAQRLARYADRMQPDDLRDRADKIRRAVARMAQLVDTTLNAARLDAGRVELSVAPIELVGFVEAMAQRLNTVATEFTFNLEGAARPIAIEGDPRLLEQVFSNLLSNAIKYSGTSRRVDILFDQDDDFARVTVRDFGIGVPAAEVPKLFTRFYRASTAKGLQGTGIGLNLVKELAVLHGGDVDVRSVVGEGSSFTVRLLRKQPSPAQIVPASA